MGDNGLEMYRGEQVGPRRRGAGEWLCLRHVVIRGRASQPLPYSIYVESYLFCVGNREMERMELPVGGGGGEGGPAVLKPVPFAFQPGSVECKWFRGWCNQTSSSCPRGVHRSCSKSDRSRS